VAFTCAQGASSSVRLAGWFSSLRFGGLASHRATHCRYKKNIKAFYLVHPNFWVKTGVLFMKNTSISKRFWKKFVYVERIKDLFKRFPASHLRLPELVYRYVL